MKKSTTIGLITFCVVAVFINNNGVTKGHSINDYLRNLLAIKQVTNLRHGILPGTLWCGRGNIANEKSQLGIYAEMDECCRAHDYCEDYIRPKSTKYGLYNKYTCRSSLCECELQFYDCLKQVRGMYAYTVRNIYFKKCKQCFRTFYDPQECTNNNLDIIEEMDRKGRRVFCAKFERNLTGQRRNISTPKSTSEVSSWDGNEFTQIVSRFYPENDEYYSNDEN